MASHAVPVLCVMMSLDAALSQRSFSAPKSGGYRRSLSRLVLFLCFLVFINLISIMLKDPQSSIAVAL